MKVIGSRQVGTSGMKRFRGFTLLELLTVIAIIAVLSGIIFPVFMRAKDNANRGSDTTNMNSLRSALQLYKVDQGGYPPALMGYVTQYEDAGKKNAIPADRIVGFLFPKRIDNIDTFRPSYSKVSRTAWTEAYWPRKDGRAVGSAPQVDINGDGQLTSADDPAGARQAYTTTQKVTTSIGDTNSPAQRFYAMDGYDVAEVKVGTAKRYELRYSLFWTTLGVGNGGANDDPRQLGYSDPPDGTVMTWNSYFRDEFDASGNPTRNKRDIVLFLGGNARPYDSRTVFDQSWRVQP